MSIAPHKKDNRRQKTEDGGRRAASSAGNPRSALRNPQFLVAVSLVVFAGLPFALGKYFELKYPDPYDSGSYVYSAHHVLSGVRVGYEEKPSAQAGTLLVNMLGVKLTGYNETGSKLLQGLFQVAAFTLMFVTVRRLYGSLAAVISVTVASIYLSAPVIAKFGNVKEQFMIALMVMGICCFVWYRLTSRWWWAVLSGALLIGGPLFKQTGVSAIAAVGLFILAGPVLYHYTWKNVGKDVLLLVAGAVITLSPICIWYRSMGTPLLYWPYSFVLGPVYKLAGAELKYVADTGEAQPAPVAQTPEVRKGNDSLILRLLPGYVSDSWRILSPAERKEAFRRVFRYFSVLVLPIVLALSAILARVVVFVRQRRTPSKVGLNEDPGRFVLLFALWWLFDMAFVFISPHSYEQYYLPLNASSAVLGGYVVGLYVHRLRTDRNGPRWIVLGLVGLLAMLVMSWHIFFGISRSPHTGGAYPGRARGYLQKWQEIAAGGTAPWITLSDYIRENSAPQDPIYVWGWVPGIYVQAQRMSSTPKAFEGTMHTLPPAQLAERIQEILYAFQRRPPKFIVDSRKMHFPFTRPPLELWPSIGNGLSLFPNLPEDRGQLWNLVLQTFGLQPTDLTKEGFVRADVPGAINRHDVAFEKLLRESKGADEAQRYEVMAPLRAYVMQNYKIVGDFGGEVLFQHR